MLLLSAVLILGFALRVVHVTVDRFHADEALYAGWALRILDGDPFLVGVPVDKPPLYIYMLALCVRAFGSSEMALRLPNLAASMLGIALTYRLGRQLYDRATGLWAALFVALSPFDILFARTVFTDPMLALWTLSSLCQVSKRRWFAAGLLAGLAFATKQHALLLLPLIVAVGLVHAAARSTDRTSGGDTPRSASRRWGPQALRALLASVFGFVLPHSGVLAWDSVRWAMRPGYWEQSAQSYGGLVWAELSTWAERLVDWLRWARYLMPSLPLLILLVAGSSIRIAVGWRRLPRGRRAWLDALLFAYAIGYVGVHTMLEFSIWDRYLLPLAPLVSLLLARAVVSLLWYVGNLLPQKPGARRVRVLTLAAIVCILAAVPACKAAQNGYPIGGEHWAYQGLDRVAAYLKEEAPADAVIYHHWLRWHYEYYLYGTEFELRWWESGDHLRREAMRTPEKTQYIVLPDWRTVEPHAEGIVLEPVFDARRQDGSISLRVYRIRISALSVEGNSDRACKVSAALASQRPVSPESAVASRPFDGNSWLAYNLDRDTFSFCSLLIQRLSSSDRLGAALLAQRTQARPLSD